MKQKNKIKLMSCAMVLIANFSMAQEATAVSKNCYVITKEIIGTGGITKEVIGTGGITKEVIGTGGITKEVIGTGGTPNEIIGTGGIATYCTNEIIGVGGRN